MYHPLRALSSIFACAVGVRPNENMEIDWSAVEEKLGIHLPADYKDFISTYGTGQINDYLYILNPVSINENINLFDWIESIKSSSILCLRDFGAPTPPFIYPEPAGVIPWGYTDNGEGFYWIPEKGIDPMLWPCTIIEERSGENETINAPMSTILLGFLSKRLAVCMINMEPFFSSPSFLAL